MPHKVWTCGDIDNNLTGFVSNPDNSNTFVIVTNEYYSNGAKSIKLTRLSSSPYWLTIKYRYTPSESEVNKTATFTADIKNELSAPASLQINDGTLHFLTIPTGENTYSISITVSDNPFDCIVGFAGATTGNLYVDNLRLNIQ